MRPHAWRTPGIVAALVALGAATLAILRGPGPREGRRPGGQDAVGPATRVVSLIPAATEILFAIGAGDRLVGRTHWGVHPAAARAVPDVGDGIRPALEAIMAREPDLVVVVAGSDNRGVARRLESLGVRTLPLTHNTLGDLERNILALGDAVGCGGSARSLVRRIHDGLADVEREREPPPVRVYYDVWPDPPMTIGAGSYLDSLLTLAGARNVFGDLPAPSPQVSLEAIVRRDPELVLYWTEGGGAAPDERPGWDNIPAIAAGRVARIDGELVTRLGPRVADAARELARAVHRGSAPADEPSPGSIRPPEEAVCVP